MAILTGARIVGFSISPNESGVTKFVGGASCLILPAGYIGSTVFGTLFIFFGFSEKLSKGAIIALDCILLIVLYFADSFFTVIFLLLSIVFFIGVLKYFDQSIQYICLAVGVVCTIVSVLDIVEQLVFTTIKASDAYKFSNECVILIPSKIIGLIWLLCSLCLIIFTICLALCTFKDQKPVYESFELA